MTQVAEPHAGRACETPGPLAADSVPHWIGGRRVEGTSGRQGPVFDPATGRKARDVLGAMCLVGAVNGASTTLPLPTRHGGLKRALRTATMAPTSPPRVRDSPGPV